MSRINTNISSIIAARVLNQQNNAMNKSLQRLSTGLRINAGADDPSGLIASEVLRGEKAAITAAINNGERARQVIATAEGSLNEVSSLLIELEDLVSTAANTDGISQDEVSAKQLQVDSILSTINRISNSTEFEGKKLLNGTLDYTLSNSGSDLDAVEVFSTKLVEGQKRTVVVEVTNSAEVGQVYFAGSGLAAGNNITLQVTGNRGMDVLSFAGSSSITDMATAINQSTELTGVSATVSSSNRLYISSITYGSDAFVSIKQIAGTSITIAGGTSGVDYGTDASVLINGQAATTAGLVASLNTDSLSMQITMSSTFGTTLGSHTFGITGGGATFSLSPDVLTGRAGIGIMSVASGSLGGIEGKLSTLGSGMTNDLSSDNLGTAQRVVKSAIKQVASLRGRLGAFQTLTIDSTINSLNVALENTTAAESSIRDTDFATETANLTRSQILVQAATTVLKNANSAPQSILALLA
jgi:flagellin